MANHSQVVYETSLMFHLKGGFYPLTVLQLLGINLPLFEQQLSAKIAQAPKFFHHTPIVIDLQKCLPSDAPIDFKQLMTILISKKLVPVGMKGGTTAQQSAALSAGLPTLQENGRELKTDPITPNTASASQSSITSETIKGSHTKVITEPVRSGQQIYVRGGDLIVLAPVSHGSELLADGHIHIYGPLRGRALAGVSGDENVHIFCHSLEPELISIAGHYKISEDIEQMVWRQAVDISLEDGRLHIRPF